MTERLGSDSVTESLETCSSALCTHSLETPIASEDKFLQNVTIRRTPSNKVSNKRNFFKKGPMPRILPSRTLKPRMKTRTLQGKAKSATNFDLTEGNNGIQNIQNSERIDLQNPNLTGNNSSSLDDSNQNDSGIRRDQIKVHTSSVPINHQSDSASTKDVHGQCLRESDDPFLSRYTPSTSSKVDAGDWSTNNDRLITRESQPLISTNPQKSTSKELYTSSPFSRSPDKTLSQPMINKEEFPKFRRNRSPTLCSSQPPQGRQTERPAIKIRPPGSYCSDRSSLTGDPLESTCSKKLLPISACSDNSPSPNVSCCYESPDSGISSENKHFIPQAGSRVSLLPAFLLDATHSADSHGRIKTLDCQMSNLNVQSSQLQTNSTKCTPKERNSGAINRNSFSVVNSFIIATETLYRSKNSAESNTHKPRLRLKSHPFSASSKESVLDTTKIDFSKRMESSLLKFPVGPPSSRAHCKVDTLQTNQHVTYCNGPALNSLPSIILDSWTKAAGDYKRKF
uniref:Uncharacterized protein n=1 Tax=Biomphalaria glabrata TaxID=6526 RepID=A0A2C9KUI0_BIOGL